MKREILVVLVLMGGLGAVARLCAQAPASGAAGAPDQSKAAGVAPKKAPAVDANPFPDDTSTIPVMPSKGSPAQSDSSYRDADTRSLPLSGDDTDPVRSPDDAAAAASEEQTSESSSSRSGLDKLLPPTDDQPGKRKKQRAAEPEHLETAASDVQVGGYYLERKNWRAALSRFQSAMVLDPENPEVYWGLAEAERHLNEFASARTHDLKLLDYDPDGPHGKQARKALNDSEVANGKDAPLAPLAANTGK